MEDLIRNALIKSKKLGCVEIHDLERTIEYINNAVDRITKEAVNNAKNNLKQDIYKVLEGGYPYTDSPLYMI